MTQRIPDHLTTAQQLGVTHVLDVVQRLYHLDGTVRGDEFDMLCPDPNHNDSRPSTSVNLTTGFWHCFSCGRGGDLVHLGMRVLGSSREQIENLLRPNTADALVAMLTYMGKPLRLKKAKREQVPMPNSYDDPDIPDLFARGFKMSTLERWDVRYVASERLQGQKGPFNIYASIGIPIEDERRRVLAWCYRATSDSPSWQQEHLRYAYTSGSSGLIRDAWFGMQHHSPRRVRDIVVVEGGLDTIWLDQCGVPALGLLGASMTSRKLLHLTGYRSVTVLGDLDSGGAAAVAKIGKAVGQHVPVRVAQYAGWMRAKDPQELSPVDLEIALARAVPWAVLSLPGRRRAKR